MFVAFLGRSSNLSFPSSVSLICPVLSWVKAQLFWMKTGQDHVVCTQLIPGVVFFRSWRLLQWNVESEAPDMAELKGDIEENLENDRESARLLVEPFDYLPPEDVSCDSCLDCPGRAVKTCLTCLVSYCEAHLRPHLRNAKFQKHRLVDPLHDTNCRVCDVHHLPYMRFCLKDSCCVCPECQKQEHEGHPAVPVKEARDGIEVWHFGIKEAKSSGHESCLYLQVELQKKCEEISKHASEAETAIEELKVNRDFIRVCLGRGPPSGEKRPSAP